MADNWYVVLELSFDPPVEDEQEIEKRIEEKSKFWSTKFNDFDKGAQYRTWYQKIPQIKKDMIGPDNRREQLALEACRIVYDPIDKLLKTIGRKGYITSAEGDRLSKKMDIPVAVIKKRAEVLDIKWDGRDKSKDYKAVYDKYYKSRPENFASYNGMKQMLSTFHVDNFYDFLYQNTSVKNADRLPSETLKERASEKKKTEFYKNDSISGTGSKICAQCEVIFKDENSKASYDKYLEYEKRKAILDEAKVVAEISGKLSNEQAKGFIDQLTEIVKDSKLSKEILTAFCKIENISYLSSDSEDDNRNIIVCRCGHTNDVSDGRRICAKCGLDLRIQCPKCGTINDASVNVCKCGFELGNIDKSIALMEQAEYAINALDFIVARSHIADATKYWPNNPKIKQIKDKLHAYEQRAGKNIEKLQAAIKAKRYIEARSEYSIIRKLFPEYSDQLVEQEISQAIERAQDLYSKAKAADDEKTILKLCREIYSICGDFPGIKELIPAPPAVTDISVNSNGKTKTNTITWTPISDQSATYVLVKSPDKWVKKIADGETIYRGSGLSYSDKSIEPGIKYYYNIFVERAGVYSDGGKGLVAVNLFEISNVSLTAADSSLSFSWDSLPSYVKVEIYELSSSGEKKLVGISNSGYYLISGLTNARTYSYHLVATYNIDGEKVSTNGTLVTGIPNRPPEPIENIKIKYVADNKYDVTWTQDSDNDVRLFYSTRRPKYKFGEKVSLAQLEREMRPLQKFPLSTSTRNSLEANEKGVSIQYSGTEFFYIVAVAIKSDIAVFGSLTKGKKLERVAVKDIGAVNGQVYIYIEPPEEATGFVVLQRFDRFPLGIKDIKTIRNYIPIKQYQLNSALVLDNLEAKTYYFSIFTEYKNGEDKDYSSATEYVFDNSPKENITYSISVVKRLFKENSVVLVFEAENNEFELPSVDIVSAVGNTPMFKSSAKLFYSIPAQRVGGSLRVEIPIDKAMAKDTYIKAFFKDEKAQEKNQLRLKLKSTHKIN